MKIHTLGFALCVLCATSLEAMDPSPADDAPASESAITKKNFDPSLAAMKGWAEHVILIVMAATSSESLVLFMPFDLPWDEPGIHRTRLDSSRDGSDALEITFAEFNAMTYGGLLETVEAFMIKAQDEGKQGSGVVIQGELRLINLSQNLPKNVSLPYIETLTVI